MAEPDRPNGDVNATPFEFLERCPRHTLRRFFDQLEDHHRISQPERVVVDPLHAGAAERSDEVIDELVQARAFELDAGSSAFEPGEDVGHETREGKDEVIHLQMPRRAGVDPRRSRGWLATRSRV